MQSVMLILALGLLTGTDSAIPPKSPFTFPDTIPTVTPVPPPPPPKPATATLTLGVWYVVESKVDAIPRVHPANLAKVTKEVGPVTLKGVFIDGTGSVETRKYAAPYLFYVEPTGVGTVEIDFIPIGLKTESEIGFRTIQVDNGQGPQPPPGPKPPDPPVPPVPVTSYRVIFVYETAVTLTPAQNSVLYAKSISDYLNANCTKDYNLASWRRFDKDTNATNDNATIKALWGTVKPEVQKLPTTAIPCLVIEVNGKATILPFPATVDECLATLKKYKEGK